MLRLVDSWIWDSWYAFDGERHHAFYLKASRALGDPDRRHRYPTVGHAVSVDLVKWEATADALIASDSPAYDDWTTWTGSITRTDDGTWSMFYTGTSRGDGGDVQRVLLATSRDLLVWEKQPLVVEADRRWYDELDQPFWHDQAWRDPWVFRGDDGQWHMYVTARANEGDRFGRGVVGHCTSPDLRTWTPGPPLSEPNQGFGQLEVIQTEVVDGVPVLLFSCGSAELDAGARERYGTGGVFSLSAGSVLGPFDIGSARRFDHPSLYAARLVQRAGEWFLLGFRDIEDGVFAGELTDPIPVTAVAGVGLVRK